MFEAGSTPPRTNIPIRLPRTRRRSPTDRTILEILIAARIELTANWPPYRITERAVFEAGSTPPRTNIPIRLPRTRRRSPTDRTILEILIAVDVARGPVADLSSSRRAKKASRTAERCPTRPHIAEHRKTLRRPEPSIVKHPEVPIAIRTAPVTEPIQIRKRGLIGLIRGVVVQRSCCRILQRYWSGSATWVGTIANIVRLPNLQIRKRTANISIPG